VVQYAHLTTDQTAQMADAHSAEPMYTVTGFGSEPVRCAEALQNGGAASDRARVRKGGRANGSHKQPEQRQWTDKMVAQSVYLGTAVISEAEWRALWAALPLEERAIAAFPLDAKGEIRDRIQWLGWRAIFAAWGRLLKLILSNPRARSAIRQQFDRPSWWARMLGYGLFVGPKPLAAAGQSRE
jgi:hypothetical protein